MGIRVASSSDAEALSILVASLSHFLLEDGSRPLPEWFLQMISADAFKSRLRSPEFYNVVWELDGRIVGYISVKQRFQIYHLFVAEQHQGKGIARKLWSHITEKFGLSKYFVRSSLYAIPAYKAFGFVEAGEVQAKDGIAFQPMELAAKW